MVLVNKMEVRSQGLNDPNTSIFCAVIMIVQQYTFKVKLGPYITYPPNYPVRLQFSATKKERKEQVLALLVRRKEI